MNSTKLLDCTLRDGAYLVSKKFGDDVIHGIIDGLVKAKIDCIEIGFLQDTEHGEGKTVYRNSSDAKRFVPEDKKNCIFTVLSDYGKFDMNNLEEYDPKSIDAIRMCFKKDERYDALESCKKIKEKGYKLFIQPVDILGYSEEELIELIKLVNDLNPYSFSIVDTFGSMYQEDLQRVFKIVDDNLTKNCKIGFHSHNNLQMSNALSQEFVRISNGKREIVIDGTISGMGRGAGNTPIELIAEYLNKKWNCDYNIDAILDLIDDYMDNIKTKCSWGYTTPYFIAGCYGTHVDNIQYLTKKSSIRSKDIRAIIDKLGPVPRKKYVHDLLEQTYIEYFDNSNDVKEDLIRLKQELSDREILIIAPGSTISKEEEKINDYINRNDPIVICVGFIPNNLKCDYIYLSNVRRFNNLKGKNEWENHKKIIGSNIKMKKDNLNEYIVDYVSLAKPNGEVVDNSTILLLYLLDILGVKSIKVAGFDGYEYSPNNYATEELELSNVCENPKEKNAAISKMLLSYLLNRNNDIPFDFLTESKFEYVVKFLDEYIDDKKIQM